MGRPKSDLLDVFGGWFEIAKKISNAVKARGGTSDDVRAILKIEGLADQIAELLIAARPGDKPANVRGLLTVIDRSMGLVPLVERAVGSDNLGNISRDITQGRFPLTGTDVRSVYLWVEPFRNGETKEEAAARLSRDYNLENTGELAGFLHDHPDEVEKWSWVYAIGEQSRWADSDGRVCVPYAYVRGACRCFDLGYFRGRFGSSSGVLVSSK